MPLSWRPLARGPASSRRTVAPEDVFTVRRYGDTRPQYGRA